MTRHPHVLAIDVGTQSARAALVDQAGRISDSQAAAISLHTPRPGWAEQAPDDWWRSTVRNVAALLERNRDVAVEAVGVGAQMHGVVPVDAGGRPLLDRVGVWSDKRASGLVDRFAARPDAEHLAAIAANPPLAAWAGFKMAWIRQEAADVYRRTAAFLVVKDFLNFRLTGVPATDPSEASGTFLMDSRTGGWSDDLVRGLGLSRDRLPDVAGSAAVIGRVTREAAALTGLVAGTPVVGGGGDMLCQLLAAGINDRGRTGEVSGTASIVASWADGPAADRRVMNLRALGGGWVRFGIADSGGASLRWFRDQLGVAGAPEAEEAGSSRYEPLFQLAADVPPGSGGLLFLPYLLGERTLGSPASRASFVGLTTSHGRPEMLRAILEGICFELRRALELFVERDGADAVRVTGGGASSPLWNRIRAGVYRLPVRALVSNEGGIQGAGLLAGVGAGWFADPARAAEQIVRLETAVTPEPAAAAVYDRA